MGIRDSEGNLLTEPAWDMIGLTPEQGRVLAARAGSPIPERVLGQRREAFLVRHCIP